MNLSHEMVELLNEIRRIEPVRRARYLNVPPAELGNRLIQCYYETSNLKTRKLVTELMSHAGFAWMRKLVTRDLEPVTRIVRMVKFSSMAEYLDFAAANDPQTEWVSTAG